MRRSPWQKYGTEGRPMRWPAAEDQNATYQDFSATELYCPRCKLATPVRQKLLLVLPDGELYEYLCSRCGTSVGEKKAKGRENIKIVF
jgi:hypothetical protein